MRRINIDTQKPLVGITRKQAGPLGVVVSTAAGSFALDTPDEIGEVLGQPSVPVQLAMFEEGECHAVS